MANNKTKSFLKTILKIAFTAIALYWVFSKIDYSQIITLLSEANPVFLFLALVTFILSKYISALRLNKFFIAVPLNLSTVFNIKLYLLGMFYNLFLPGGIGGDGYKVYLLSRQNKKITKPLVGAVLLDRITGVYALVILTALLFLFTPFAVWLKIAALISIPISFLIFYLLLKKFWFSFSNTFITTNGLSFVVQLSQLFSAWMILISLGHYHDIELYLFVFLISSVVSTIPFTIGGLGAREVTFMIGAQYLNLDLQVSIALSLAFYLITVAVSSFGLYYSIKPLTYEQL